MSRRAVHVLWAVLIAVPLGCLTVNVYFYPSEEVDKTAKQIIEDIRGQAVPEGQKEENPSGQDTGKPGSQGSYLVGVAYAADRETLVSNPAIEALKGKLKERSKSLTPYFNAGAIGEGNNGLVILRDVSSLPMKDRAILNRLVKEENADRTLLYREVAKSLGVKKKDLPQVRRSFAKQWRETARPGWWVQDPSGNWHKR